jgi:hypothetical protein
VRQPASENHPRSGAVSKRTSLRASLIGSTVASLWIPPVEPILFLNRQTATCASIRGAGHMTPREKYGALEQVDTMQNLSRPSYRLMVIYARTPMLHRIPPPTAILQVARPPQEWFGVLNLQSVAPMHANFGLPLPMTANFASTRGQHVKIRNQLPMFGVQRLDTSNDFVNFVQSLSFYSFYPTSYWNLHTNVQPANSQLPP